jgi:acyl-CoA synthetase
MAACLVDRGFEPGDRLATVLADGPEPHLVWLAAEKAGVVSVGIGGRAGDREIAHLLSNSGARAVISDRGIDGAIDYRAFADAASKRRVGAGERSEIEARRMGAEDLWMLNSTSGTTGLPKLVTHTQRRWAYFHSLAAAAGEFHDGDVFCSALPSPYGFGLWTAHFSPTYLGAPTHLERRFNATAMIELLAAESVSVLAAVTTQLILMLNSPALTGADLSSLRVVFTGGEAVPYEQAAAFEDATGSKVLQFYGSNETGAASRTTTQDSRERRLTTAGKVIDGMHVRLFDPVTKAPIGTSGRGQPGCRGPATCEGYYGDEAANRELYTEDGWMLMGDLVEIDDEGYLTVIGRTSDIIIRGGKNISTSAVEAEVMTHPDVSVAAAVAVPDPIFGERLAIYVETSRTDVTLDAISAHLMERGVTREWFPEYLVAMDLPRSSGGKVAKGELREDARRRFGGGAG